MKISSENLALDLRSLEYQFARNSKARLALTADIAYYAGELAKEVNPFRWRMDNPGRVIDVLRGGRDVREQFGYKDELQRTESGAGGMIVNALINEPVGALCVWISPPGGPRNYPEARLTVGLVRDDGDGKELEGYGINASLTQEECLIAGLLLSSIAHHGLVPLTAESLRGRIFLLDKDAYTSLGLWDFLAKIFPLPAWEEIKRHQAHRSFQERLEKARPIADQILPEIQGGRLGLEVVETGVRTEEAIERSYGVRLGGSSCGGSYKDSTFRLLSTILGKDGRIESESVLEGKFVRRCGNCGAEIGRVISRGYHCPNCGGVYEGC